MEQTGTGVPAEPTSAEKAAWSSAEYAAVQKDEVVGALLAFFLGTFGAHWFYLGRNGLGILYAAFFWTGIPSLCGFVETFLMPGRVRAYNFARAQEIAVRVGVGPWSAAAAPPPLPHSAACAACGQPLDGRALFCPRCGAAVGPGQQRAAV